MSQAPTKPEAVWGGSVLAPLLPLPECPLRWSGATQHRREEGLCHLAQEQGQRVKDKASLLACT